MDRFLRALPSEERKAVGLRNPTSPRELLDGLECALATLEIGRDLRKADFRPPPRRPQGRPQSPDKAGVHGPRSPGPRAFLPRSSTEPGANMGMRMVSLAPTPSGPKDHQVEDRQRADRFSSSACDKPSIPQRRARADRRRRPHPGKCSRWEETY
ncbi:hypothetical protein KOW79_011670 [Hemibagrus wyckioides]|uniref:Uncharacterized protein n=1 Tax=Hemibagrus wyckioides TaxID=337641 RepID=A0A9D3SN29_9TELE|nr:hypothetical protein KOW79_011670 [Hemibagrus wyckioides]